MPASRCSVELSAKVRQREKWLDLLRDQVKRYMNSGTKFKVQAPSRGKIIEWISSVWNDLPSSTIVNGFTKCKLVNGEIEEDSMDGGYIDQSDLAVLMENMVVEDMIDPSSDIDNEDAVADHDDDNLQIILYLVSLVYSQK